MEDDLAEELEFAAQMLEDLDIDAELGFLFIFNPPLLVLCYFCSICYGLFVNIFLPFPPYLPNIILTFLVKKKKKRNKPKLSQQDVVYLNQQDVEEMTQMQDMAQMQSEPVAQQIVIGYLSHFTFTPFYFLFLFFIYFFYS